MAKKLSKTGIFKVNRDASANYSNEKKKPQVAREYKITTYSDGTFDVTPKESKPKKAPARKTASKRKPAAKKTATRKGRKQYYDSIWVVGVIPAAAWGAIYLIGGGSLGVAGAYQVRKGIESGKEAIVSAGESADKFNGLAKVVLGGMIVLYGMYLISKYK